MGRHEPMSMRTLDHPGSPLGERARVVRVRTLPLRPLVVAAGDDLFERVHATLDRLGAPGGCFTLRGGIVARLSLMTGGAGEGDMPMGFHGPHLPAAPLTVVAGAGGVGVDAAGARFTHCHAAFTDRGGRLIGGHLIVGQTIAGPGGIAVDLVPIEGGRFARRHDPETCFDIFHPEAA